LSDPYELPIFRPPFGNRGHRASVVAEFVRLYHGVSADDAQKLVEGLVTRQFPVVQDFDGHLKVLRSDLGATRAWELGGGP
jgi:hypothetical protein